MAAIALAIFSPNMAKINSAIGLVNGIIIFFIFLLLVILLDIYLRERRRKKDMENKIEELSDKFTSIAKELDFMKERFKTLEDFSEVKAKVNLLERRNK